MKRAIAVAVPRVTEAEARLERITHLEQQLSLTSPNSRQRRGVREAIRIEAGAYRKSLDTEQTTATHDPHPPPALGPGFLSGPSASRTPLRVARRKGYRRSATR